MKTRRMLMGLASVALLSGAVTLGSRFAASTTSPILETEQAQPASPVAMKMTTAAKAFLADLPPELRRKANLGYDDKMRLVWHYYPRVAWERTGVMLKELNDKQRESFKALLRAGTSEAGYETALNLMKLEAILRDIENTPFAREFRDPERFHLTIFGKPGPTGRWCWKLEGHHLLLNYVIEDGRIVSATPFVFGANPARVPSGPQRGLRILPRQEDLGRRLYTSLSATERKKALLAEEPPFDLLTNADTRAKKLPLTGVRWVEMNPMQGKILEEILQTYTGLLPQEVADKLVKEIKVEVKDKVHFAWSGAPEPGKPHYYQINSPWFLIEYCNVQNNANHIHVVWRDYANDFGENDRRDK